MDINIDEHILTNVKNENNNTVVIKEESSEFIINGIKVEEVSANIKEEIEETFVNIKKESEISLVNIKEEPQDIPEILPQDFNELQSVIRCEDLDIKNDLCIKNEELDIKNEDER